MMVQTLVADPAHTSTEYTSVQVRCQAVATALSNTKPALFASPPVCTALDFLSARTRPCAVRLHDDTTDDALQPRPDRRDAVTRHVRSLRGLQPSPAQQRRRCLSVCSRVPTDRPTDPTIPTKRTRYVTIRYITKRYVTLSSASASFGCD